MTDYLRIVGPFHAPSGYSHMTRAVLRMALLAGYDVQAVESDYRLEFTQHTTGEIKRKIVPPKVGWPLPDCQWDEVDAALATTVPDDAPTLLIQLPPNLNQRCHYTGSTKIGYTMIESDTLCPEWTYGCRGCDTILVPSRWCVGAFQRAGLADVRLMPIPVDDRLWSAEGFTLPLKVQRPPFLFVSVFSTTERKQWRLLMHAFCEEFRHEKGEVGLVVHPTRPWEVDEMAGWCVGAGAWIYVDKERRSDHDMAALYRQCDCYVMPSPEGFGLPFIEAAMCGIPSIALGGGGAADVVTEDTGYPLPCVPRQMLGHMPHVYGSDQRFPLTRIDDLRAIMRRAYEDRGAGLLRDKGWAAKSAAREFTPAALAPRFREEIHRAAIARTGQLVNLAEHRGKWKAYSGPERPQYALAIGAWGDAFVSYGIAQEIRNPHRRLCFIHYGYDAAIADWLRCQPDVDSVIQIQPPAERRDMLREFSKMCQSRWAYTDEWLSWIADKAGVPSDDILFTQINQSEDQPLRRVMGALPAALREWAHMQRQEWGPFILLHPISVQSAHVNEHWPLWQEALRWLLKETPHTYVLTGTVSIELPESPQLIDLIGKTKTMMEVLALCETAAGVISTCNAVSLWTAMQKIPGLIVSNAVFNCPDDYYLKFIDVPTNVVMYQYETLEWFKLRASAWLAERFGLPVLEIPWAKEVETREEVMA